MPAPPTHLCQQAQPALLGLLPPLAPLLVGAGLGGQPLAVEDQLQALLNRGSNTGSSNKQYGVRALPNRNTTTSDGAQRPAAHHGSHVRRLQRGHHLKAEVDVGRVIAALLPGAEPLRQLASAAYCAPAGGGQMAGAAAAAAVVK